MRINHSTLISLAILAAHPAQAAVVGGAVTGGTSGGSFFQLSPGPGFTVGNDNQQDNNLYAFNEVQNHVLLNNVGSLLAGTRVSSHYVFFDPGPSRTMIGGVTFDGEILAILTSTGAMFATDAELGRAGVTYLNPGNRGLEAGDTVAFAGNTMTMRWTANTPGDYVRVITAAAPVPEPTAWAMLLVGFFGLGTALRRRARPKIMLTYG